MHHRDFACRRVFGSDAVQAFQAYLQAWEQRRWQEAGIFYWTCSKLADILPPSTRLPAVTIKIRILARSKRRGRIATLRLSVMIYTSRRLGLVVRLYLEVMYHIFDTLRKGSRIKISCSCIFDPFPGSRGLNIATASCLDLSIGSQSYTAPGPSNS